MEFIVGMIIGAVLVALGFILGAAVSMAGRGEDAGIDV